MISKVGVRRVCQGMDEEKLKSFLCQDRSSLSCEESFDERVSSWLLLCAGHVWRTGLSASGVRV
jgi:hypothetical protein